MHRDTMGTWLIGRPHSRVAFVWRRKLYASQDLSRIRMFFGGGIKSGQYHLSFIIGRLWIGFG